MGSQDKSESEAHLDTQINPICKVSDTLHTGVRYAADYLVGNYVNPPLCMGQHRLLAKFTGEKQ